VLEDIIEKPDPETFARFGDDVRVSMNCWRFGPRIFEACRKIPPSPRGEVELPNAVRYAVRTMGERFRAIPVDAGVLDLSRREDIAEVERRLADVDARP
jgi:glucose-1-phosphate thymidylyltransferase